MFCKWKYSLILYKTYIKAKNLRKIYNKIEITQQNVKLHARLGLCNVLQTSYIQVPGKHHANIFQRTY